jgi:uncharacterized membrane protein YccC
MGRLYRQSTRVFATLIAAAGVMMVVVTLARGGGPFANGVVLGALFMLLGVGRLILAGAARHDA